MRVVFIFAEGAHDVAFIKQVFKFNLKLKDQESIKLSSFPKPLDDFFLQRVRKNSIGDVSLDMTRKFLLPDCVFKTESLFIMLFNTGGMENYSFVKCIVSSVIQLIKLKDASFDFEEEDIKWFFTYDSDYKTIEDRVTEVKNALFPITVNDATDADSIAREIAPEILLEADNQNVFFHIWDKFGSPGTIEDILIKIYGYKSQDLIDKSSNFIDTHFSLDFLLDETMDAKRTCALKSKRLKACITIAGQGKKPGRPLSAIINDNTLATGDVFLCDDYVKSFALIIKSLTE